MIRNAFATAAYRMGHSLLRKTFFFSGSDSDLHTQFNRPDHIYEEWGIEKCTRGLYENAAQSIDEKITQEVTWKQRHETMVFSFWRSMAISRPILPINIFFTKLECS
jgi:hypothetical protein